MNMIGKNHAIHSAIFRRIDVSMFDKNFVFQTHVPAIRANLVEPVRQSAQAINVCARAAGLARIAYVSIIHFPNISYRST